MIVGLALLRRELALQLLERSLLERQPTGDVVALTLSMRNLALRSGMILHLNVVRHAQYLRQQVSSPLGSTQWVLAPTPIWLARHPSQSGHREMRTFISMDSISRNDTPRFFMLSRNASKSAKALPGPHSPCGADHGLRLQDVGGEPHTLTNGVQLDADC